jgi:CMP-N-acetylneuraminic acid synthetase
LENSRATRIICLIPARKGSLGLIRKNLKLIGCFTLVNRAIRVARNIEPPVHLVLSSDDESIIRRYKKKVDTCIERKAELSTSDSLISDVILDALQKLNGFSNNDILVLLEPTSPNRTISDINNAIKLMIENNYESLTTVSLIDSKYHPYKLLKSTKDLELIPFITDSPPIFNRQQIKDKVYYRNGIAYLYKLSTAHKLYHSLPDRTHFLVTDRPVSNIDNNLDLWLARIIHISSLLSKVLKTRR